MTKEEILEIMRAAYEAPKDALGPLDWKPDKQRERILRIPIACDCYPLNITGVSIMGTAWADEPDERVTFQLLVDIQGKDYRISRIDWKPRQGHTNKFGPPEYRGLTVLSSIHDFPENADMGLDKMMSMNLPIAKPIEPDPQNFNGLLIYLRDTFRLRNALDIPEPPWAPQLI